MSVSGNLLFLVCAAIAVGGAVATVWQRSPLRAAMSLLIHILALAGIFLTLHAHLLAALQLMVYAGAVVVLFIFVIMLIGPSAEAKSDDKRGLVVRTVSLGLMGIITVALAGALHEVSLPAANIAACPPGTGLECGQFGGVEALGRALYTQALAPFELVSVLLLVAIVGAVAVARGRSQSEAKAAEARRVAAQQAAANPEGRGGRAEPSVS